jgi:hypothetical protein
MAVAYCLVCNNSALQDVAGTVPDHVHHLVLVQVGLLLSQLSSFSLYLSFLNNLLIHSVLKHKTEDSHLEQQNRNLDNHSPSRSEKMKENLIS